MDSLSRNPMQEALDLTWSTLNARMRNYRIASFLLLGGAALLLIALILFGAKALLLALALPPIILAMVGRDQRLVQDWESKVLGIWKQGSLPLAIFAQAITAQPGLLKSSRAAMAAALPVDAGDFPASQEMAERILREASGRRARNGFRLLRACLRTFLASAAMAGAIGMTWSGLLGWVLAGLAAGVVVEEVVLARRCAGLGVK